MAVLRPVDIWVHLHYKNDLFNLLNPAIHSSPLANSNGGGSYIYRCPAVVYWFREKPATRYYALLFYDRW